MGTCAELAPPSLVPEFSLILHYKSSMKKAVVKSSSKKN